MTVDEEVDVESVWSPRLLIEVSLDGSLAFHPMTLPFTIPPLSNSESGGRNKDVH